MPLLVEQKRFSRGDPAMRGAMVEFSSLHRDWWLTLPVVGKEDLSRETDFLKDILAG